MKELSLRFHLAFFLVMSIVAGTAAAPASTLPADGYWRLTGMWRERPDPLNVVKPGVLLSYRLSSIPTGKGTLTMMDFYDENGSTATVDEYDISWEWTAIPTAARPGDELPMTLRGTVATQPHGKAGMTGICYPNIQVSFYRPSGEEWVQSGGFEPAIVQFNSSDSTNLSGLARTTGTFPSAQDAGSKLSLTIYIEHPSARWDWAYVYEWDDGPFPDEVSDPIPGGQTTIDGDSGDDGVIGDPTNPPDVGNETGETGETGETEDSDDPLRDQLGSMTIQADRRTVEAGGTVTVPIRLLNGNAVGNLDYKITYDPTIVRPQESALKGNLLSNASMQSNVPEEGRVWIAFATTGRIDGDGTLAEITFEAIGEPGQKTVLGIEVTMFNDSTDSSRIERIPGEIEILTPDGRVLGDLNNNGILDAGDAMDALKMAVRLIPMDLVADMDGDQTVTSADARIILRKAAER